VPPGRRDRIAVFLLCAALAVVLAYPGVGARKRTSTYGIAFFGDSVSVGAGASDPQHGYVARVSSWLRMRGKRVIETVNAKGGVPVAYWQYAAIPRKLNAAVVELGTNDVRLGTPSAQFAQAYRTLTSRIRAANPKAQLLCLSVWSHRVSASVDGMINAQIRRACPGTYVDITGLRHRSHIRSSDGFHPNDVGHRLIARAVESKLKTS
jgi:lysophospholipase L1-like esterase